MKKSFEERLPEESARWVAEGLVSAGQRAALIERHPAIGGANRFLGILASVGGTLFTVGVSLVIKSNWEQIHDWVKIVGVVGLLAGFAALGWRLKMAPGRYPKTGDACFMASAVFFLLGIALVSQVFHLQSRPANGVLLWWFGIVALPWVTRAKGAQFVSVVAALTWLGMEFDAQDSWLRLERVAGGRSGELLLFPSAGAFIGIALTGFGVGLRRTSRGAFAGLHEKLGLILLSGCLYGLSFTWSVHPWSNYHVPGARWQPVVGLVLLLVAVVVWVIRTNRVEARPLGWAFAGSLVPAAAHLSGLELGDSGWLWGGVASLALFLLNLGMIRVALVEGQESWVNLGIAFIALNVVTRYFLLFGSMLDGGLFFIVSGLLVLGLGCYLERKRRSLVDAVRQEDRT